MDSFLAPDLSHPVPGGKALRRRGLAACALFLFTGMAAAQGVGWPAKVPAGTRLVLGDQNELLQTLFSVSGVGKGLVTQVQYANFIGGPAILEAFRAGALDVAVVGNTPPIQAHAAGEEVRVIAARRRASPSYQLAGRPGLPFQSLKDLRGKRIAYAEGTAAQPFVLAALQAAGLKGGDVKLVPLRLGEFSTALRTGQVDVAPLSDLLTSRYLRDFAAEKAQVLPPSENTFQPTGVSYLYASKKALADPARQAALSEVVQAWTTALDWAQQNRTAWAQAYYVKKQGLSESDALTVVQNEGAVSFPLLREVLPQQQATIDLIHAAGGLPHRLDAREEFDFRFDAVVAAARPKK
ncbi:MAG: ABC transporter substrate-binding protein [Burkholderiaceae bacterium]|nr:ABC transporter substrate-binding protein [Burkholderiaceae bacterium]